MRPEITDRTSPARPDGRAGPSAEEVATTRLELKRIVESIAHLSREQRAVFVLRDVQGLSGTATAGALGISRAAMKSHRAREAFRAELATDCVGSPRET